MPSYRRPKTSELIAREIVANISGNAMQEGDPLASEAEMLELYGVGRASLREALRMLESHGLVTMRSGPGGGATVGRAQPRALGRVQGLFYGLAGATYRDLAELTAVMAEVVAGRVAQSVDPDVARDALRREEHPVDDLRSSTYVEGFHTRLFGLDENPAIAMLGQALESLFTDHLLASIDLTPWREDVHDAHDRIADAIIAGDAVLARKLAREHQDDVLRMCEERAPGVIEKFIEWQ